MKEECRWMRSKRYFWVRCKLTCVDWIFVCLSIFFVDLILFCVVRLFYYSCRKLFNIKFHWKSPRIQWHQEWSVYIKVWEKKIRTCICFFVYFYAKKKKLAFHSKEPSALVQFATRQLIYRNDCVLFVTRTVVVVNLLYLSHLSFFLHKQMQWYIKWANTRIA